VKKSTMNEEMKQHAMATAFRALSQYTLEKDAAKYIKQEFDSFYGRQWHCVVGQHFGCYVSHFLAQFVYFYVNSIAVMLYRTADETAIAGQTSSISPLSVAQVSNRHASTETPSVPSTPSPAKTNQPSHS